MIKYENECCGCDSSLYPCVGESCHLRHVPHYYCDNCEDETQLYEFDDKQLCLNCIENELVKIN